MPEDNNARPVRQHLTGRKGEPMSTPSVADDGTVHLDLSERVTKEAKARQLAAAGSYMTAFAAARVSGATYDEASAIGRRQFEQTWKGGAQ